MSLTITDTHKFVRSEGYNYNFDKRNGLFIRWGATLEEDPVCAPSPEIADIEITTICHGPGWRVAGPGSQGGQGGSVGHPCPFCYKNNTPNGKNMSLETFKKVIDALPSQLTQCALGADAQATSNPDLFEMMAYCRQKGVIPNITVADITDEIADKLVAVAGAVAVSRYANKDICYDSVKKLTDRGLLQTNIHVMTSEESYDQVMETLNDKLTDSRLVKLNAVVFLALKQRGRGVNFHPLNQEKFKSIIDFAFANGINLGLDSCSCFKFLESVKDHPDFKRLVVCSEPCESGRMSIYINVDGLVFPCSFSENMEGWTGLDVAKCDDFVQDIWMHPQMVAWREKLCNNNKNNLRCIECPIYNI